MSGNYSRQISLIFRVAYNEIGQHVKLWALSPFMDMFSHRVDNSLSGTVITHRNAHLLKVWGRWWESEVGWWEVVGAVEKGRGRDSSKGSARMQLQVDFQEKEMIWIFVCWLNWKRKNLFRPNRLYLWALSGPWATNL